MRINELWQILSSRLEAYQGICGKHADDGILCYFISTTAA